MRIGAFADTERTLKFFEMKMSLRNGTSRPRETCQSCLSHCYSIPVVSLDMRRLVRDMGYRLQGTGFGIRDMEYGIRKMGYGTPLVLEFCCWQDTGNFTCDWGDFMSYRQKMAFHLSCFTYINIIHHYIIQEGRAQHRRCIEGGSIG